MKRVEDYNYSYNHVKQRLREIYNIKRFSLREYDYMNQMVRIYRRYNEICNRDGKRYQHHIPIWMDRDGDQECWAYLKYNVVYSRSKDRVITVLELDNVNKEEYKGE